MTVMVEASNLNAVRARMKEERRNEEEKKRFIYAKNVIWNLLKGETHTIDELCKLSNLPKSDVVSVVHNLLKAGKLLVKTSFDVKKGESTDLYFTIRTITKQKRIKSKKKSYAITVRWNKAQSNQRKNHPPVVRHSGGHGRRPYPILYGKSQFEGQETIPPSTRAKLKKYGTLGVRRRRKGWRRIVYW